MTTKIMRIEQIARRNPKEKFTSVYPLIDDELLLECFNDLDGVKLLAQML